MQSKNKFSKVATLVIILGLLGTIFLSFGGQSGITAPETVSESGDSDYIVLLKLYVETVEGPIAGDSTEPGMEGLINVLGYSHQIITPRDEITGLPTGKRQHKPFRVVKELDKASPKLMSALVNTENLVSVELKFYKIDPATGVTVHYYTIELVNANIAAIQHQASSAGTTEHISFIYQKIIWTYVDGGISVEDDWAAPVVYPPIAV